MRNPLQLIVLIASFTTIAGSSSLQAKPKPSLHTFAGSYTGTATSRTAGGVTSSGATLTFTGRPNRMRGTFLYTGILNSGQTPRSIVQVLNVSTIGVVAGRVTVDGVIGSGRGTLKLRRNKLTTNITYTVGGAQGTTIAINGKISFGDRRAKWVATVKSNDPSYDGRLAVIGKR